MVEILKVIERQKPAEPSNKAIKAELAALEITKSSLLSELKTLRIAGENEHAKEQKVCRLWGRCAAIAGIGEQQLYGSPMNGGIQQRFVGFMITVIAAVHARIGI